jgi:hypothetical protein
MESRESRHKIAPPTVEACERLVNDWPHEVKSLTLAQRTEPL